MKKLIMLAAIAFAGIVWADRTANRDWVGKNFAPSNIVPRVEALEAGADREETDPVFGAWKDGTSVHIGHEASAGGDGCILIGGGTWSAEPNAIAIGVGADCEAEEAVAIGKGAVAGGWGAVQLGPGRNDSDGSFKFGDWTVVDSEGNIPEGRLKYALPSRSHDGWGDYGCVNRPGIVCFEQNARYDASPVCGLDEWSIWNRCFRAGEEGVFVNFGGETLIVDTDGKINPDCLPELHVTEDDPVFVSWRDDSEKIILGKDSVVDGSSGIAIGAEATSTVRGVAVGKGAIASGPSGLAVGNNALSTSSRATAVGTDSCACMSRAVAVGNCAECGGADACQIGCGTNNTDCTLQFLNWRLVGSDGKIPADRLSAANVLTSIKAMDAAQLAELKTFLGIGQ